MRKLLLAAAALIGLAAQPASAVVINAANVSGFSTFQDTMTGRIWLDMDNFFDRATGVSSYTGNQAIAAAQSAGFTFASKADVMGLLGSLPLGSGEWSSYAPIMGYGAPRALIWGLYDMGGGNAGYAWSWSYSTSWGDYDGATACLGNIACGNGAGDQDLGVWAYLAGEVPVGNVPEPVAVTLLGLGLAGLGVVRRRRAA